MSAAVATWRRAYVARRLMRTAGSVDGHTGCMSRPYGDVRDALGEGNFSRVGSTRGIILQSDGSRAVREFGQ